MNIAVASRSLFKLDSEYNPDDLPSLQHAETADDVLKKNIEKEEDPFPPGAALNFISVSHVE